MLAYYSSSGYEALKSRPFERVSVSVVGSPFDQNAIPTVVRYCCDQGFREWIDNGAPPIWQYSQSINFVDVEAFTPMRNPAPREKDRVCRAVVCPLKYM